MAVCRYCGKKAGWFRDAHENCILHANTGIKIISKMVSKAVVAGETFADIKSDLDFSINNSHIPQQDALAAIKEGWDQGAQERSKLEPISGVEQTAILNFYRAAGLTDADVMGRTQGSYAVIFSHLIWTVLHDKIEPFEMPSEPPPGCRRNEEIPGVTYTIDPRGYNLQRGEVAVWGSRTYG